MKVVSEFLKQIKTGNKVIYRGHADEKWELKPSIGRHFEGVWSAAVKYESQALEEFKNRSVPYIKSRPTSDIEWLCLMQHHGCATRLLDFTTNPLIALFFASDPSVYKNGEVIAATYNRSYENVSNENIFERKQSFAYYPPHITERIIGQAGCFVYSHIPNMPLSEKQMHKIQISHSQKLSIRSELKILGISYSTIFPGLDGMCKDINDPLVLDIMFEGSPF